MKFLYLIPARGGSKGIPRKNIKPLGNKPLIAYSIETACQVASAEDICVSTDDREIISIAEKMGLKVPFVRPSHLAQDNTPTREVILHAIEYYAQQGKEYDTVVLLQPTSPFRHKTHIQQAIALFHPDMDMVVSVKETKANPYYILYEEDENGFLKKSKNGQFSRRQDCPKVYEFNGSIYVINVQSLKQYPLHEFRRIKKYVMEKEYSVDLDDEMDWAFAEFLIEKKIIQWP